MNYLIRLFVLLTIVESPSSIKATSFFFGLDAKDTCAVNDICTSAIDLEVYSDFGFACATGCDSLASPEMFDNSCGMGQFPTVWFRVFTDNEATTMNIKVQSDDIESPNISLFLAVSGCDYIQPVGLTSSNIPCIQGFNGEAKALGTAVGSNSTYFIAVTDPGHQGGSFELCVNTLSQEISCVQNRNIEITNRSNGGPLEGPFEPGETISICFNVNSYSAAGNGCQWFQGLVPVFGNGWDPSSFDAYGLPLNATINGNAMGVPGNGNYGNATWDSFYDVDYHFDNPRLQILDIDHNGTLDMCNSLYDPDCPDLGGIHGGCCGPCWGTPLGDILPPGWFAYGINGTCPTPGPPVRVDWGDGNTCGGGMGPWKFCFDLKTRSYPACKFDKSSKDLSLSFFTFADGETGSWTGGAQICYDQPAYLRLGLNCRTITDLGTITLPEQCSGNLVAYELFEPGVSYWQWEEPYFVNDSVFEGANGDTLMSHPHYTGTSSATIIYNLIGHLYTGNIAVKKIIYRVWPKIEFQLPEYVEICENKPGTVTITPGLVKGGKPPYNYLWSPSEDTLQSLMLHAPFQSGTISLTISDTIGCLTMDSLLIKLKPCQIDDPGNEPNDTINPQPPLPNDGNFTFPDVKKYNRSVQEKYNISPFQIHPSPTYGSATIEWSFDLQHDAVVEIFNSQGFSLKKISVNKNEGHQKQIDTQSLTPGVYFVSFSNGEFRYVTRLVKM